MSVLVDKSLCQSCGKCIQICPGDLLEFDPTGKACMRDAQDCWDCMACVKACSQGAISTKLPYQLADYKAMLQPTMHPDRIVWVCTDLEGNKDEFIIKTLEF